MMDFSQILLVNKNLKCLQSILQICFSFCSVFERANNKAQLNRNKIAEFSSEFDRQASFLYTILSGMKNSRVAPHLSQLLATLDFNTNYTKAKIKAQQQRQQLELLAQYREQQRQQQK